MFLKLSYPLNMGLQVKRKSKSMFSVCSLIFLPQERRIRAGFSLDQRLKGMGNADGKFALLVLRICGQTSVDFSEKCKKQFKTK